MLSPIMPKTYINPRCGRIELIIGCMYASKTSKLLSYYYKYKALGKNLLTINYIDDTRYGKGIISTHNQESIEALCLKKLLPLFNNEDYKKSDVIFINEGQFFDDLYNFCVKAADVDKKTIFVCGLDGDFERKSFKNITDLIPMAENVHKLSSCCIYCKDGTPGNFTKRLTCDKQRICIGGTESYAPVCRHHFLIH